MNGYVVDASIAVSWFFEDENSDIASAALALLNSGAHVAAPAILWFELHNAILVGVKRRRLLESNAAALLGQISEIAIKYDALPVDGIRLFSLASRHRLTFYDAAYLELAQRAGVALATLDRALAQAGTAENITLVGAV